MPVSSSKGFRFDQLEDMLTAWQQSELQLRDSEFVVYGAVDQTGSRWMKGRESDFGLFLVGGEVHLSYWRPALQDAHYEAGNDNHGETTDRGRITKKKVSGKNASQR